MPRPHRTSAGIAAGTAIALLVGAGWAATLPAAQDQARHLYDVEYPVMHYPDGERTDAVARLMERVAQGETDLGYVVGRGYLDALLAELGIDADSQSLVFSRTSAQTPFITMRTPRAVYYSDDVYVGWPPDAPYIEIAAMDPNLGPVFYTLSQDPSEPRFERQMDECLRCHDTYSLTGGGVPRYILGSGYTDDHGEQVTHEGWILVDDRTPLRYLWGGWYVTGTHGQETHMGNWAIRDLDELQDIDLTRTGNVTDLSDQVATDRYLAPDSDIVAQLVMGHQTHVQNVITRVNYEVRKLLGQAPGDPAPADLSEGDADAIAMISEPLVEALLMVGQPGFTDTIAGTTDFARRFQSRGPVDRQGRTLRELDLHVRLFRYPVSYLICSEAFDALPEAARRYVYRRVTSILEGRDEDPRFAHISPADGQAVLDILQDTKPGFEGPAATR